MLRSRESPVSNLAVKNTSGSQSGISFSGSIASSELRSAQSAAPDKSDVADNSPAGAHYESDDL